ncbi:nucleosome-remodeling factor subunit NURF301-like [Aedes albopictus]|uniref:Uncharacterized protein n=1 Tax=Aedes albopictus TaxID=7160 RepID=A0ABM1XSQ9_AEDAL
MYQAIQPSQHQIITAKSPLLAPVCVKYGGEARNAQRVLIRPLGNNQAQIVARIKTQPDGTTQVIPLVNPHRAPIEPQPIQQGDQAASTQQGTTQRVLHQPVSATSVHDTLTTPGGSQKIFHQQQPSDAAIRSITPKRICIQKGPGSNGK